MIKIMKKEQDGTIIQFCNEEGSGLLFRTQQEALEYLAEEGYNTIEEIQEAGIEFEDFDDNIIIEQQERLAIRREGMWMTDNREFLEKRTNLSSLKDTIYPMMSENYQDRFRAEYFQAKIRHEKLSAMLTKYDEGTLEFTPSCPIELLKRQQSILSDYIKCLEERAEIEKVLLWLELETEEDQHD